MTGSLPRGWWRTVLRRTATVLATLVSIGWLLLLVLLVAGFLVGPAPPDWGPHDRHRRRTRHGGGRCPRTDRRPRSRAGTMALEHSDGEVRVRSYPDALASGEWTLPSTYSYRFSARESSSTSEWVTGRGGGSSAEDTSTTTVPRPWRSTPRRSGARTLRSPPRTPPTSSSRSRTTPSWTNSRRSVPRGTSLTTGFTSSERIRIRSCRRWPTGAGPTSEPTGNGASSGRSELPMHATWRGPRDRGLRRDHPDGAGGRTGRRLAHLTRVDGKCTRALSRFAHTRTPALSCGLVVRFT